MTTYKITFIYPRGNERSTTLEAPNAERAAVNALLERRLPAYVARGKAPQFWHARFAGAEHWPAVVADEIVWGGGSTDTGFVRYRCEALPQSPPT